jgi:tRNA modification GTPase
MTSIDELSAMSEPDTIAAIATAAGPAGIAIVRLSGPDSFRIADEVYAGKQKPSTLPACSFTHGHIRNGSGSATPVDEVILLAYRAPHSYTREDVVEIQCHGGRVCAERILGAVIGRGARPAQPGEFTKRAFLNGRLDLLQAEAVADLISARSRRSAEAAVEQLQGSLSCSFNGIYDGLCSLAADVEAMLDFAEDELPEATAKDIFARAANVAESLEKELESWEEGHLLREGAPVVISGKPNVGKSTLMNVLLGKERAIVADSSGTTRDTLEESLVLGGVAVRLVDTAGLCDSSCQVEREGVRRAVEAAGVADLRLHVIDASLPLDEDELKTLEELRPNSSIVVLNKCDLGQVTNNRDIPQGLLSVTTSLVRGQGVKEIGDAISDKLLKVESREPRAAISARHKTLVESALSEMKGCCDLFEDGVGDSSILAAQHMRVALECLGMLTGREYSRELLDSIFSRFCIGK